MLGRSTLLMRHFAGTKLMMRNLPWTATRDEIINSVKAVTQYEKLDMPINLDGRNRGFAFVTFTTEAEKEKATAVLNALEIQGRKISVHEYIEQPRGERPPRTGGYQRFGGRGGDFGGRGGDFGGRGGDFGGRGGEYGGRGGFGGRGGDFGGRGEPRGEFRPREPRPPQDIPPTDSNTPK